MDTQKKCWVYQERLGTSNALKREQFLREVAEVSQEQRVYIDQSGVDNTLAYAWGWSPKGVPCQGERLGHKTQRVSMMAALCQGKLLAPLTFQGTCYAALVEAWMEQQLLPLLQPGQVIILDNAAFHRHPRLRAILAYAPSWPPKAASSYHCRHIPPTSISLSTPGTLSRIASLLTKIPTPTFKTKLMPLSCSLRLRIDYTSDLMVKSKSTPYAFSRTKAAKEKHRMLPRIGQ